MRSAECVVGDGLCAVPQVKTHFGRAWKPAPTENTYLHFELVKKGLIYNENRFYRMR